MDADAIEERSLALFEVAISVGTPTRNASKETIYERSEQSSLTLFEVARFVGKVTRSVSEERTYGLNKQSSLTLRVMMEDGDFLPFLQP